MEPKSVSYHVGDGQWQELKWDKQQRLFVSDDGTIRVAKPKTEDGKETVRAQWGESEYAVTCTPGYDPTICSIYDPSKGNGGRVEIRFGSTPPAVVAKPDAAAAAAAPSPAPPAAPQKPAQTAPSDAARALPAAPLGSAETLNLSERRTQLAVWASTENRIPKDSAINLASKVSAQVMKDYGKKSITETDLKAYYEGYVLREMSKTASAQGPVDRSTRTAAAPAKQVTEAPLSPKDQKQKLAEWATHETTIQGDDAINLASRVYATVKRNYGRRPISERDLRAYYDGAVEKERRAQAAAAPKTRPNLGEHRDVDLGAPKGTAKGAATEPPTDSRKVEAARKAAEVRAEKIRVAAETKAAALEKRKAALAQKAEVQAEAKRKFDEAKQAAANQKIQDAAVKSAERDQKIFEEANKTLERITAIGKMPAAEQANVTVDELSTLYRGIKDYNKGDKVYDAARLQLVTLAQHKAQSIVDGLKLKQASIEMISKEGPDSIRKLWRAMTEFKTLYQVGNRDLKTLESIDSQAANLKEIATINTAVSHVRVVDIKGEEAKMRSELAKITSALERIRNQIPRSAADSKKMTELYKVANDMATATEDLAAFRKQHKDQLLKDVALVEGQRSKLSAQLKGLQTPLIAEIRKYPGKMPQVENFDDPSQYSWITDESPSPDGKVRELQVKYAKALIGAAQKLLGPDPKKWDDAVIVDPDSRNVEIWKKYWITAHTAIQLVEEFNKSGKTPELVPVTGKPIDVRKPEEKARDAAAAAAAAAKTAKERIAHDRFDPIRKNLQSQIDWVNGVHMKLLDDYGRPNLPLPPVKKLEEFETKLKTIQTALSTIEIDESGMSVDDIHAADDLRSNSIAALGVITKLLIYIAKAKTAPTEPARAVEGAGVKPVPAPAISESDAQKTPDQFQEELGSKGLLIAGAETDPRKISEVEEHKKRVTQILEAARQRAKEPGMQEVIRAAESVLKRANSKIRELGGTVPAAPESRPTPPPAAARPTAPAAAAKAPPTRAEAQPEGGTKTERPAATGPAKAERALAAATQKMQDLAPKAEIYRSELADLTGNKSGLTALSDKVTADIAELGRIAKAYPNLKTQAEELSGKLKIVATEIQAAQSAGASSGAAVSEDETVAIEEVKKKWPDCKAAMASIDQINNHKSSKVDLDLWIKNYDAIDGYMTAVADLRNLKGKNPEGTKILEDYNKLHKSNVTIHINTAKSHITFIANEALTDLESARDKVSKYAKALDSTEAGLKAEKEKFTHTYREAFGIGTKAEYLVVPEGTNASMPEKMDRIKKEVDALKLTPPAANPKPEASVGAAERKAAAVEHARVAADEKAAAEARKTTVSGYRTHRSGIDERISKNKGNLEALAGLESEIKAAITELETLRKHPDVGSQAEGLIGGFKSALKTINNYREEIEIKTSHDAVRSRINDHLSNARTLKSADDLQTMKKNLLQLQGIEGKLNAMLQELDPATTKIKGNTRGLLELVHKAILEVGEKAGYVAALKEAIRLKEVETTPPPSEPKGPKGKVAATKNAAPSLSAQWKTPELATQYLNAAAAKVRDYDAGTIAGANTKELLKIRDELKVILNNAEVIQKAYASDPAMTASVKKLRTDAIIALLYADRILAPKICDDETTPAEKCGATLKELQEEIKTLKADPDAQSIAGSEITTAEEIVEQALRDIQKRFKSETFPERVAKLQSLCKYDIGDKIKLSPHDPRSILLEGLGRSFVESTGGGALIDNIINRVKQTLTPVTGIIIEVKESPSELANKISFALIQAKFPNLKIIVNPYRAENTVDITLNFSPNGAETVSKKIQESVTSQKAAHAKAAKEAEEKRSEPLRNMNKLVSSDLRRDGLVMDGNGQTIEFSAPIGDDKQVELYASRLRIETAANVVDAVKRMREQMKLDGNHPSLVMVADPELLAAIHDELAKRGESGTTTIALFALTPRQDNTVYVMTRSANDTRSIADRIEYWEKKEFKDLLQGIKKLGGHATAIDLEKGVKRGNKIKPKTEDLGEIKMTTGSQPPPPAKTLEQMQLADVTSSLKLKDKTAMVYRRALPAGELESHKGDVADIMQYAKSQGFEKVLVMYNSFDSVKKPGRAYSASRSRFEQLKPALKGTIYGTSDIEYSAVARGHDVVDYIFLKKESDLKSVASNYATILNQLSKKQEKAAERRSKDAP